MSVLSKIIVVLCEVVECVVKEEGCVAVCPGTAIYMLYNKQHFFQLTQPVCLNCLVWDRLSLLLGVTTEDRDTFCEQTVLINTAKDFLKSYFFRFSFL